MDGQEDIAKAISNCRSQWSEAPDQPISQIAHFSRAQLYEGREVFGQGTEVHQRMGRILSFKQKKRCSLFPTLITTLFLRD